MGVQARVLSAALVWLLLLLQGCGSGGGDDGDDAGGDGVGDLPPAGTYTVSATVSGLAGRLEASEYARFNLRYTDATGDEQSTSMLVAADGPFTFREFYLPDGVSYSVTFNGADRYSVKCEVENGTGTIASANVGNVNIACIPAYTVGGAIKGIALTVSTGLALQTLHNAQPASAQSTIYQYSTSAVHPFYTGGNDGFLPGDTFDISVGAQPADSDATCFVRNGSGTVAEADVVDVEVLCSGISVSYEVTGLSGSGLIVRLSAEPADGNSGMEMLEEHAIASSGFYGFDEVLFPGQPYRLEIRNQPSNPSQQCFVENGEGAAPQDSFYVTAVKVICPSPYRSYRFDNQLTQGTDTPLASGEQTQGVLYQSHTFGDASVIGAGTHLGAHSGFDATDLFQVHIDDQGAQGVVYSNSSGRTFWAVAESPIGVGYPQQGASHHNLTDLTTWWLFRKESDSATLQLEVSEVFMLGFDDTHAPDATGRLYTEAHLWVRAFRRSDEGEFTDEVFSRHGGIALQGKLLAPGAGIDWALLDRVDPTAAHGLWKVGNFFFDLIGDEIGREPERVALAFLVDPIPIPIDISAVPVGEQFYVNARTVVLARNSFSPEGGTAVFLRDPATFDAGDPDSDEPLDDPGSVRVVTAEGLTLLAVDSAPQPAPGAGVVVPPACESSERSVLELGGPAYRVTEGAENSTLIPVIRTGSLAGLVRARVRIEGGTALADEDFEPREIDILFGNEDDHPRTVELPIIDDDAIEPDENLTVMLVEPQGCADIGAQSSAQVTIVDDDNRPGAIAFASATFQVNEAAGVATIQIVRTGGHLGVLNAALETSDGTAFAAEGDYTPLLTTITFADGDTGPLEVQVPIGDDLLSEADETFELTLSSFTSQINDPSTMTVTIVDNDQNQANTVQFAAAAFAAVEASGRATISLARHGDTSAPASVTVTANDGTAIAGQDYEPLSTIVAFAAGEAVREIDLVIVSDALPEADETVNLALSAPVGIALGVPAAAQLVITEEDPTAWGSWQSDVEIDASAGVANDAQIAFDANGHAIALWVQENGNHTDIWSNYYEPGVGWASAVLVEANDADRFAGSPRVAFDGQGNAIAVWVQTDAVTGNESAWASRFTPGTGWDTPERLETGPDVVFGSVEIAMSSSGDAIAAWTQFDGTQPSIYANRYVAGSGWIGAEVLNEQTEIVRNAHVATDHDGDMLVVWQQSPTGVSWNIRARRYTQAAGWAPSNLISTTNTGSATGARVAFDSEGDAIAVWLQNPGFDRAVYAARYSDADGWDMPELIGEGDGADHPRLSVGPGGSAIAIWQRPVAVNGTVALTAFANRFTLGSGWGGAEAISTGAVFYPKVAVNPDGNALAAWFELNGASYSVWSNRYTLDIGWRSPEQVGSSGGLIGTFMPNLAFGPQGEAFAIWTRGGEVRVNNFRLAALDAQ